MIDFNKLYESFYSKLNICELFQLIEKDTWERIEFSRLTPGFKIHENTITQNLLFHIEKFNLFHKLNAIKLYESKKEYVNGNDIDCLVKLRDGKYLQFPIQAKIIYHKNGNFKDGLYSKYDEEQCSKLIEYAKKVNGVPLYLLYNFVYNAPIQFGCSIVLAENIKAVYSSMKGARKRIKYSDLHPPQKRYAVPFSNIPCHFLDHSIDTIHKILNAERDLKDFFTDIKTFTLQEIPNSDNWILILPETQGIRKELIIKRKENKESRKEYLPVLRIVLEFDQLDKTNSNK